MVLGSELTTDIVETKVYWYGMWSTRRSDQMPKGFVQVELDPENDHKARLALNEIRL